VGEELYKKFKRIRVAFIGVENTVRSVLAEALAKEMNTSPKLGFVSGGISSADAVDPQTMEALGKENISWRGKPKDVARISIIHVVNAKKETYNFPPFTDYKEIERKVIDQGKDITEKYSELFQHKKI